MVIESLKAQIAALTEAMKEKDVPAKVMTTLKESTSSLQTLLDKAREAAKEGYEEEEEEESGMKQEEDGKNGDGDGDMPEPGHTITKTMKVKHDKHQADGDGKDEDEEEEKKSAEESRKVHIQTLLKEAGIPKGIWGLDKLMGMSLKEAKAEIAEKKAYIDAARKMVEGELDFVPTSGAAGMHESTGEENLNSLFHGCAE